VVPAGTKTIYLGQMTFAHHYKADQQASRDFAEVNARVTPDWSKHEPLGTFSVAGKKTGYILRF